MAALLEVKNLQTQFNTGAGIVKAVDGVSFRVNENEIVGIVGESGCGKSVTASSILQIVPDPPGRIVSGEIWFKDENLLLKSEEEMCKIRGKQITMIFQEPMTSLNPVFRVGSQIEEAVLLHQDFKDEHGKTLPLQRRKEIASKRTIELLEKVGIPDAASRARDYPHQLSGGMRQRVMIAMALVCQPDLLIADEPTTALDVTVQAQILDLLLHLQKEFQTAIILITHDFGIVAEFADEVAVMYAGQIVEQGGVEKIFANPLHPYTRALLRSIPRLDLEEQDLYVIPGKVPNSSCYPPGCRFAPRCPSADAGCRKEIPELTTVEEGHTTRCFLAASKGPKTEGQDDA